MLTRLHHRGFTMVELMIGIVLLAIVLAMGGPSFATWMQNTQIRNMSEAIQNGIHLARAEAVRRNAQVRFQLVDSLTSSCALSTSGPNWIVSMDSAVGDCASTNMADASAPAAPRVVQSRSASDGSPSAVVAASQSTIVFNGLGRPAPTPVADITIDISNPNGGACLSASGPMRCLRIVVGAGGQIRMCDPRASFNGTSEGC
jgi:type IV fimbrial biogenesis protein FimT